MAFMKFSKGKAIYSVPNGLGDGSAYFDGNSYGYIPNTDNLPFSNFARTISCWVYNTKLNTDDADTFFSYGYANDNQRFGIGIEMGACVAVWGYGNTTRYTYAFELNKWYHVVITFNTDYTEQCYVNGVLIGSQTHSNINTIKDIACVGKSNHNDSIDYFNGNIKELQVYNRILSATEVTQLYKKQEVTSGRVLYIPLTYGKDKESIFSSKNFVYDTATLTTSRGFDEFGYPIRYDIASECGIAYSLLPTKGLIFYAPCETDINVEVGNQFTDSGSFTTQFADGIPCLKFSSPCRQEVDTSVFIKNQVTLSAWYYYTTSGDRVTILGYGYDRTFCAFCLQETNGQFTIERASGRFETGFCFESNKWYHLSVTLDDDTIKCYVNGELINTFTYAMDVHSGNLAIGGWVGGGYSPNGYITKCRIYNRPLTDKEIKALAKEI